MTPGEFFRKTLTLVLCTALAAGIIWRLNQVVEQPVVVIDASTDILDNGLPVYAQFVVTQTLTISEPTSVSKLDIPVYFPTDIGKRLLIEMRQDDLLVGRWRYAPNKAGEVETASLPIFPSQTLEGEIAIQFSASDIDHSEMNEAPRLFVETAGHYYKGGNYFIADNSKTGDVSLGLYAQKRNQEILGERWQNKPLSTTSFLLIWVALLLLVSTLPHVVIRSRLQDQGDKQKDDYTPKQ